jgi:hypothetical protein
LPSSLTADASRGKAEAQVDPVTDHNTGGDKSTLEHDHFSALVRAGSLRLPAGHGGCVETVAEAGDDTTDNEVGQAEGRGLQSCADDHDGGADDDHAPAAEGVADEDGHDGTEEAAQVVAGDGDAWTMVSAGQLCENPSNLPWCVDRLLASAGVRALW